MITLDELQDLYHPSEDEDYLLFQRVDIMHMLNMKNVLLANEMGTGKTIEACGLINFMKPESVLIICPNNLRFNWLNEVNKWVSPELIEQYGEIEMCTTSLYIEGSPFVIASFEGMTRWVNVLKLMRPRLILVDEGHFLKNEGTKRYKASLEIVHAVNRDETKIIVMTGTPIPNYPYELFNLINYVAPDQWNSRALFERRYCPYKNKYAYHMDELQKYLREGKVVSTVAEEVVTYEVRMEAKDSRDPEYVCTWCKFSSLSQQEGGAHITENPEHEIEVRTLQRARMISMPRTETRMKQVHAPGIMIRRLKKEVLPELPKKRRQVIELPAEGRLLELVNQEREMYERAFAADKELDEILTGDIKESDEEFEEKIESLRFTRKYLFEEMSLIRHELAKAKVPYVIEHIGELLESGEKLVCFIHHRDVGEAIRDAFRDRAVLVYGGMAQERVYEYKDRFWNDEKCQLFIGSLKMAGVGLNLQVASNIVFAELDWVPGTITQAEDRCHRIGQENPLLIQHLVARDSMDSSMAQRIIRKQKSINKALNRPKEAVA